MQVADHGSNRQNPHGSEVRWTLRRSAACAVRKASAERRRKQFDSLRREKPITEPTETRSLTRAQKAKLRDDDFVGALLVVDDLSGLAGTVA